MEGGWSPLKPFQQCQLKSFKEHILIGFLVRRYCVMYVIAFTFYCSELLMSIHHEYILEKIKPILRSLFIVL
jgi:hypothetical protein